MRANQRRFWGGILGELVGRRLGRHENRSQKQNLDAAKGVPRRLRQAACALFLLALAVSVTLAGRAAQQDVPASGAAPNSSSLNGPGNVFLTANLIRSGGSAFGAAVSVASTATESPIWRSQTRGEMQ
jgi:hypothetical protein